MHRNGASPRLVFIKTMWQSSPDIIGACQQEGEWVLKSACAVVRS